MRELGDFLRFPSISAQSRHFPDIRRCAKWLAEHLRTIGLEHVEVVATAGHPLVTADWLHAPGRPTLLIYGHYDVQPPDPLGEWESPPFEPVVRGGYLHARGAADDKGQLFLHIKALESYLQNGGSLPINVRCVFEGEEEIGSASLCRWQRTRRRDEVDVGGTIPVVHLLQEELGIPTVVMGFALADDGLHGPNERFRLSSFSGGIETAIYFLSELVPALPASKART